MDTTDISDPVAKALLSLHDKRSLAMIVPVVRRAVNYVGRAARRTQYDPKEAQQEAMIRIVRSVRNGAFHYDGRPATGWVFEVARRGAVSYLKRQQKERPSTTISLDRDLLLGGHYLLTDFLPDPEQIDPSEDASNHLDSETLFNQLQLSKTECDVARGRAAGRTYEELSEELGKGWKTIDNCVTRINRKMGLLRRARKAKLGDAA
jgi:RNA polymerase sigma factor (sigma-70 family)